MKYLTAEKITDYQVVWNDLKDCKKLKVTV